MTGLNYEEEIEIDEKALDIEWLNQPRLFLKYAQYAAFCKQKVDSFKERLDVQAATLDKEIRLDPDKFALAKITESTVQNTIISHPDYRKKMREYIDAKYELELAGAAVRAFDQRKGALENMVKLHGMSYFAGPSVPRDLTEEKEQRSRLANQRVKMKRRA